MLPNIPEDLRTDLSDESIPLETRLSLARKLSGSKGKLADYRGAGEGLDTSKAKKDMTPVEKAAYIHKHGGDKYAALA